MSLEAKLLASREQLSRQLCRRDFINRHDMPNMSQKQFWKRVKEERWARRGWKLATLEGGYELVLNRAGVLYLIGCYVAVPVKARDQRVIRTMRRAYTYLL